MDAFVDLSDPESTFHSLADGRWEGTMPVRNSKASGGRTAKSPARRAAKTTAKKRTGKVRRYDARREAALEAARESERKLDAWIASQEADPVIDLAVSKDVQVTEPADLSSSDGGQLIEVVFTTGIVSEDPWDGMLPMDVDSICRRLDWSYGDARQLVRRGYTPEHASRMTGWPVSMLEDVKIGKWA
jgi:hypothetical protein